MSDTPQQNTQTAPDLVFTRVPLVRYGLGDTQATVEGYELTEVEGHRAVRWWLLPRGENLERLEWLTATEWRAGNNLANFLVALGYPVNPNGTNIENLRAQHLIGATVYVHVAMQADTLGNLTPCITHMLPPPGRCELQPWQSGG